MRSSLWFRCALWCAGVGSCATALAQTTVQLVPVADTTLFSESGYLADGLDDGVFVGTVAANQNYADRRAVLRFDPSSIPAGATVLSASLQMYVTKTISGPLAIEIHALNAPWGEGTSYASLPGGGNGGPITPNSASWTYTFYPNTGWTTPGGDFSAVALATATTGVNGAAVLWTSQPLAASVQSWMDSPASNYGWILVDPNPLPGVVTAKRLASREYATASQRPTLTVTYSLQQPASSDGPIPLWALAGLGVSFTVVAKRRLGGASAR